MTRSRTVALSSVAALAVTCSFALIALPGGAAEPGLTYDATATGEVLRIHELDPDFSGTASSVDVAAGRAHGVVDVADEPRSRAEASNLAGSDAGTAVTAGSSATSTTDTAAATQESAPAGAVTGLLEHGTATLTSRARWGGDDACAPVGQPLTTARSDLGAVRTPATEIPLGLPGAGVPLPTGIPTEIPTELPTGLPTLPLPTDLPTDLPTTDLPTLPLPTESLTLPTESLTIPTLPTEIPTTILPTILPAPDRAAAAPGDAVSLVEAAPATVVATTGLAQGAIGNPEGLTARVTGSPADTSAPALSFFGGEVTLTMSAPTRLTAYSPGTATGSTVTHEAADVVLSAGGEAVALPTDGALAVPSSQNEDVVVVVSRGELTEVEDASGRVAGASVSAVDIVVRNGDDLVLRASYLPMTVRTEAPEGGVLCPRDTDGDRLLDRDEIDRYRTNPERKDTDRDRLNDRVEVKKYKTNPRRKDTDRDRLNDRVEVKKYKTNPRRKDTDRDGVSDFKEIKRGTNPRKP